MLKVSSSGSFQNIENALKRFQQGRFYQTLNKYGEMGVKILAEATPKDSGRTADSWRYEIRRALRSYTITWTNDHIEDNVPIAVILQYGHGTGTGGWVEGQDYINPATRKLFDDMANDLWKEVTENA